jgi:hypothetical protein
MECRALVYQVTAKNLFQLNGITPHTFTFGTDADISNLCRFGHEWVYFHENLAAFPFQKEQLARYLGPAKNEDNEMAQWVLKDNGKVVPQWSIRHLSAAKLAPSNEDEHSKRENFSTSICGLLGDSISLPATPLPNLIDDYWEMEPYGDDVEDAIAFHEADLTDTAGKPFTQHSLADTLINAKVLLPNDYGTALARVVNCVVGPDSKLIGEYKDNPLLNSLLYECKFNDGTVKEYAVNTIASNIFIESDEDGFSSSILYHIVDHKSSGEAVKMADKYFLTSNGTKHMRQTTQGWMFLVEWSNGSRQWINLKLLKESNPVQVAEYATSCNITEEPAFAW